MYEQGHLGRRLVCLRQTKREWMAKIAIPNCCFGGLAGVFFLLVVHCEGKSTSSIYRAVVWLIRSRWMRMGNSLHSHCIERCSWESFFLPSILCCFWEATVDESRLC